MSIQDKIENKQWKIQSVGGNFVLRTQNMPYLTFDFKSKQLGGYTGCNHLGAAFEFNTDSNTMRISSPVTTRRACAGVSNESDIVDNLEKVHSFELDENNFLRLFDMSGIILFLLKVE